MEQLDNLILSWNASAVLQTGEVAQFSLRIYKPQFEEGRGYYCVVECPFLRKEHFKIFGVDEVQACELSVSFINQMIEDDVVRMLDEFGQEIAIPEIDWEAFSVKQ